MDEKSFQSGALPDVRPVEERERDFHFEEIVAGADPVAWSEKKKEQWRKFPIFNQNGSGSCVAQTMAKELGILRWLKDGLYVHFSATDIYQQRINKNSGGMGAADVHNIVKHKGATLEILCPSQNMTDAQMDAINVDGYKREISSVFKISNYVELPMRDIDTVASTIQKTRKGVMVWFYFKYDEWNDYPTIKVPNLSATAPSTIRHSVTAVDFALVNGKKSLIIEDSWGPNFGLSGQRVISEDFFKVRNFYAAYLTKFNFEEGTTPPPSHSFSIPMNFGDTNNEVKNLQDALRSLGHFPTNVASTGFYGSVTAKAVLEWQKKYNVDSLSSLEALAGRVFGPKSMQKMNQLLNN